METILLYLKTKTRLKKTKLPPSLIFVLFCSYFPVIRFLYVILINMFHFFRVVVKVFDWLLSKGYDIRGFLLEIVLKVLDKFPTITSIKLLKGQFLQNNLRKN